MTTYRNKYYIGALLEFARFCLNSMVSFQAAVAVIFTGIWAVKILTLYHVEQSIIDSVFVPCALYFLWVFGISLIDVNIERDVL
jgi:hypothetical protein